MTSGLLLLLVWRWLWLLLLLLLLEMMSRGSSANIERFGLAMIAHVRE
jgi:hypothetical protein